MADVLVLVPNIWQQHEREEGELEKVQKRSYNSKQSRNSKAATAQRLAVTEQSTNLLWIKRRTYSLFLSIYIPLSALDQAS